MQSKNCRQRCERRSKLNLLGVSITTVTWAMPDLSRRKREVTLERKKAAEERRRIEEEKAKVTFMINTLAIHANLRSQMGQRKAARLRRKAGRSKKING